MKTGMLAVVLSSLLIMNGAYAEGKKGSDCAKGGKMIHGGGPGMGLRVGFLLNNKEMAQKAGLTDAQIALFQGWLDKNREEMGALRGEVEKARLEIEKLMAADQPDEAALLKAVEEAGAVETRIQKSWIQLQLKIRNELGRDKYTELVDKQKQAVKRMMDERRDGKGGHKNKGPDAEKGQDEPVEAPGQE